MSYRGECTHHCFSFFEIASSQLRCKSRHAAERVVRLAPSLERGGSALASAVCGHGVLGSVSNVQSVFGFCVRFECGLPSIRL